ncbi:MAG TPA: peptidoglycan recognition family protein, partial [Roseiflexaceae bacterium]|nr:peptidoglycan recognition family protein [Roseiflexaceae bacterium]
MAPIDDTPTGMPPMIGKRLSIAEWIEYARSYQWGTLKPSRLVLHHTYIPNEQQWRGLSSMRGMQRFYAGKGWTAAPHMYCGPDGIWLFTPMREVGIHAGTGNGSIKQGWYSIGCEMVGYFDKVKPQGAVWENARAVMGILSSVLDIPPRKLISFHRDYTNTKTCPGSAVTKEWVFSEVEAWMAANIKAPPVRPAPQPTPPVPEPARPGIPPHTAELVEQLLHETYRHRSQGYNAGWAFHQWATQHDLGAPLGKSKQATLAGATWNYEVFGRDVLFCEVPHWGDVRSLVRELASTPTAPHLLALRDAVFRDA